MAQFDVLKLRHLEALGVVVEVLVDLALVDEIREELLQVPLARDEDEDRRRTLAGVVVDDDVEVVDLLDKLLARLLREPEQELVDHQHDAAKALGLGVLRHAREAVAPAGVDARIGRVTPLVRQPRAREALARLRRAARDALEVLAAADDALRLEPLPDDVAVLLRLAPDLLEDRIDIEELEGRLAAPLERGVEALVDSAVEAGALASNGEHVDAHDEQARLREPGLVVRRIATLARLRILVRVEERAELLPRRLGALEQQREHGHEVRLAASEATVDEAPVLLAAVEDLLHVVEDAGQLFLDGGRDDVVVDELLDLVRTGIGLAQLDDEAHRPNVLGARKIERVGDGRGHDSSVSSLSLVRLLARCGRSSGSSARAVGGGKRFFQSSISSRLGPSGPTSACSSAFSRAAAAASSRATSGRRRHALSSRPMRSARGTPASSSSSSIARMAFRRWRASSPAQPIRRFRARAARHLGEGDEALSRNVELAAEAPVFGRRKSPLL